MEQTTSLSVVDSFAHKNVLITGVTGFLGKSIVEKLLRELPNLGKIFLLIRGNGSSTAQARCQKEVFESQLFEVLRCSFGSCFEQEIVSKVHIVAGDMTQKDYGLDEAAFMQLANDVDLIINSAASVDFREPMDQALNINTLSLLNILSLCDQKSAHLPSTNVLHISTCYVNGFNSGDIDEQVLAPASNRIKAIDSDMFEVDSVIEGLQLSIESIYKKTSVKQKQREQLIQLGIKKSRQYGWNDTYTFTKWLGEQLLIQRLNKQNLTIVRPSIIESAIESPIAGWVEGVKVADALIYAYAKGRVSIFPGKDDGILDVIPVDLVSNSVLLASAELMHDPSTYRIYQCCSGELNPITLKRFIELTQQAAMEQYAKLPRLFVGKPQSKFNTVSPDTFKVYMFGLKTLTWFKTLLGRMSGSAKASQLMEKANTTASLATIFGFYTAANYRFLNPKLIQLSNRFSTQEKAQFKVNADCFNWNTYLQDIHLPGLHEYALKDRSMAKVGRSKNNKKAA